MKAIDNRQPYSLAARILKIVGIILIVSFLLDCLVMLFPASFLDRQWQMGLTSRLVDRGIIPMVGLAFLFAGFGIESNAGLANPNRKIFSDIKFWALLFSSLLGLLFLLLFPLHLNNISLDRTQKLDQVNQQASQMENKLQSQLKDPDVRKKIESQMQEEVKNQFNQLLTDEQKLNEALKSDALPPQVKDLLRKSKEDPKALDQYLEQRVSADALGNQQLTQIRGEKEKLTEQIKISSVKSGLQTGISSLLLAVGYVAIGWSGLKGMGYLKVGRRKTPVR